jgi:eukaryotic-like serine/threonine-protein kinase
MAIRQRPAGSGEPTELIEPPAPPAEPPPDRELWPWLLVLLLLVVAGLAAAWFAMRDSGSAPAPETVQTTVTAASAKPKAKLKKPTPTPSTTTVVVPDLLGQSRDEAIQALEAQGLKADVNEVPSDRPKDTVVSQHPAGGTKVDENSAVLLNVAKGEEHAASAKTTPTPAVTVPVPDVTGQSVHEAKAELEAAGLEAKTQHVPSTEPKDTVVLQSPGGGAQAQPGDHVLLDVSKGEPKQSQAPATSVVPSVIGEGKATAKSDLHNAGFKPVTVDQDTEDPNEDGIVLDQSPPGGTTAAPRSQVAIYVGRYRAG